MMQQHRQLSGCGHDGSLLAVPPTALPYIKLSSLVSDLLGVSARRMLHALAEGETDPAAVAALAHHHLRATPAELVTLWVPAPSSARSTVGW
jgi:hypothetical protein